MLENVSKKLRIFIPRYLMGNTISFQESQMYVPSNMQTGHTGLKSCINKWRLSSDLNILNTYLIEVITYESTFQSTLVILFVLWGFK